MAKEGLATTIKGNGSASGGDGTFAKEFIYFLWT